MRRYLISKFADENTYKKQCASLEKHMRGLVRKEELMDVDGSLYMSSSLRTSRIFVMNSIFDDAVYIRSEYPLEQVLAVTTPGYRVLTKSQ